MLKIQTKTERNQFLSMTNKELKALLGNDISLPTVFCISETKNDKLVQLNIVQERKSWNKKVATNVQSELMGWDTQIVRTTLTCPKDKASELGFDVGYKFKDTYIQVVLNTKGDIIDNGVDAPTYQKPMKAGIDGNVITSGGEPVYQHTNLLVFNGTYEDSVVAFDTPLTSKPEEVFEEGQKGFNVPVHSMSSGS